jgi:LmbE family N-acetylglucosaminyl deacetylase
MKELNLDKYDKIVILAPHPDDEVLGCYSLFSRLKWLAKLHIVYLTNGCFYDYPNIKSEKAASIRKAELENLCDIFEIPYYCMNIKDTHLKENKGEFLNKMLIAAKLFDFENKKIAVFMPHKDEKHEDHKCVYDFMEHFWFNNIKHSQKLNWSFFYYEVWTPMTGKDYYHIINPELKKKAIEFYPSQIEKVPYIDGILGLNRYRALQAVSDDYREVFKR